MKKVLLLLAALGISAFAQAQSGVETLQSGVRIEHRVAGTGPQPAATSNVTVHYTGTFQDGRVFDSSVSRGAPASFALNRVVPCWTEALQHMHQGGTARIFCPAATAYGARGAGNVIPPNTDLNFEVQLLAVK